MKKTRITAVIIIAAVLTGALFYLIAVYKDIGRGQNFEKQETDGIQFAVYDLGESSLTDTGNEVLYHMQGTIGVPQQENCPVVLIINGNHPITVAAESRYDEGFSYLVKYLASQGYVAVALNVSINYSFEDGEPSVNERTLQVINQSIERLAAAFEGKSSDFPVELKGKGDLNQLILVGHSRGGCDVIQRADKIEGGKIKGIVSIAPAIITPFTDKIIDVPIGIILPQYDGDVIMLDGYEIFDLASKEDRKNPLECVYLKNANHGGFNSKLTVPDMNASKEEVLISSKEQQDFLSAYINDFVKAALSDQQTAFGSREQIPQEAYQQKVLIQIWQPDAKMLYLADEDKEGSIFLGETLEQALLPKNAGYLMKQSDIGAFRLPGALADYPLLQIAWKQKGAVSLPGSWNLSGRQFLDLNWAVDSTDESNKSNQKMTLELMDENGSKAHVDLSKEAALELQEGKVEEILDAYGEVSGCTYSTFTPIVTTRIPLSGFQGINMNHIIQVKLIFNTDTGSVMIKNIRVK